MNEAGPLPIQINPVSARDQAEWDAYWTNQECQRHRLYDAIAVFYRKFLIRRALNFFIRKHFAPGSLLLHAGCGGGQVDTEVVQTMRVTALDISIPALTRYQKLHGRSCEVLHGSIFDIPRSEASFNGVYNLGVMEHFTEDEIQRILAEFYRVLKPGGKILLFWPPEFGLSVAAFKLIYFAANRLLKKNVKLCPDELTRIRSKCQVKNILERSRFKPADYYFGPKDLFTYAVIAAVK